MKQKKESVSPVKIVTDETKLSLSPIEIEDSTTTKGKATGKFSIVDETEVIEQIEKLDKNKVFAEVTDFFCPVKFESKLDSSLRPLVDSGLMSEDVYNFTIAKEKKEFLEEHKEEIEKSEGLSFAEVLAKLKENDSLYQKVLKVCNISEIRENDYISQNNGKVQIFRANQCQDKEGKDKYTDVTLRKEVNGKIFESVLFVEYREVTTTNIILSIRYRQSYLDACRRLQNQINDYNRILTDIEALTKKAKEFGFSLTQIMTAVNSVFA